MVDIGDGVRRALRMKNEVKKWKRIQSGGCKTVRELRITNSLELLTLQIRLLFSPLSSRAAATTEAIKTPSATNITGASRRDSQQNNGLIIMTSGYKDGQTKRHNGMILVLNTN